MGSTGLACFVEGLSTELSNIVLFLLCFFFQLKATSSDAMMLVENYSFGIYYLNNQSPVSLNGLKESISSTFSFLFFQN